MNARAFAATILLSVANACAAAGALGTSAAVDSTGRLWIAHAQSSEPQTHVVIARSDDAGRTWQPATRVTSRPEPVSADGENRPKLAFGPQGDLYVSWTSPTEGQYTADIRFARSTDGGRTWSEPIVVHQDRQIIAHRFESMIVDRTGRIWLAWIDKRDLSLATAAGREYAGAAVYYAYSEDRGRSWQGDFKLADHSCECCRIALSTDNEGRVAAMWRHVFQDSERDHAFALLPTRPQALNIERATFDRWRIDGCPHHGPSLVVTRNGARHAVWFNQTDHQGRVFYGQLSSSGPTRVRELPTGAVHADIAANGDSLVIAWKRFDGSHVVIESLLSRDAGNTFSQGPTLRTDGDSDQPRLVATAEDILLVWRREEGVAVQSLSFRAEAGSSKAASRAAATAQSPAIKTFTRTTLSEIERAHAGQPFWVLLWDLECTYCMKSLQHLAQAQRERPSIRAVTIATDSIHSADALRKRLLELGVTTDAYAFSEGAPEALRFAIDPSWMGEKPRAYHYDSSGKREAIIGVIDAERYLGAEK